MKDYYKILEINRNASVEDIKLSFRKLAKKYHPDSNTNDKVFNEIMQDINEAYDILSNSDKKSIYDKEYDIEHSNKNNSELCTKSPNTTKETINTKKSSNEKNNSQSVFKSIYNWSSSWTGTIVIVLGIIFFVAQAFVIPSGSMKNTLLIGDMLFVKKFSYGIPTPRIPWLEIKVLPDFNDNGHLIEGPRPQRGDIVVFRYPKNELIHYVKRAVATGGDLVAIKDKNLFLHPKEGNEFVKANYPKESIIEIGDKLWVVNPYMKEHPGIHHDPSVVDNGLNPNELFNMMPIMVPEDETFMMGDNRDHSNDSRFWGTVHYKYIVGKPWFIYFSWDDNFEIRWDRVLRTVESLEEEIINKDFKIEHKEGIY